jgi:Bacteriophage head to tail connecting protein
MDTSEGLGTLGTPNTLLETLRKRYNAAKYVADLWIPIMQACFFYSVPFRNRYYLPGKEFQGTAQNTRVYDTTAVEAVKTFVSKLHDSMTPPQIQWGFLEVDEAMVDDADQQAAFLESTQIILNKYTRSLFRLIHGSNFDVVINECYFDLCIGTSALVINQYTDDMPFLCTSIPMDKLAIEEAVNGKIESWFRTWQNLKIAELNTRWPKITFTPDLISDLLGDPDAKVRMIYEGVAYFANMPKPYLYAVWCDTGILYSEYLESSPGIIWRFQKTNNETWGRGPVMEALPSIISLNEMARMELAAANLNVFKPYMGFSDAVFNPHTFRLEPFTIIPIAPIGTNGQVPLIPLPGSSDVNFAQLTIADLRLQIKALLFAEEPQDQPGIQPQTAYELSLKQQNTAQKIGPLFSRLQQECLVPVFKRFMYIANSMGILPYPKVGNIPIKFKYKSPLALVKGEQDVARFIHYVQTMQGIMGQDATSVYINPKTTPYLLAESLQIDMRFLNKPDEVAKVMQGIQDQHNQQQLAQSQGMMPQQPPNPSEQIVQPAE